MSETTHLKLPYLESAQAQKHVTVNEALRALDALVHLSVKGRTLAAPPASPGEGDRYIVGPGATGLWTGADRKVAAFTDGAWQFFAPQAGWRAHDEGTGDLVLHDGTGWRKENPTAKSPHGAATEFGIVEGEHALTAGTTNDTSLAIPDRAIVLGITGRVLTAITGAISWNLGVAADATRYGNGIGVARGSTVIGPSGTPVTYWATTPLKISSAGGAFAGGRVRLAIHYIALTGPDN